MSSAREQYGTLAGFLKENVRLLPSVAELVSIEREDFQSKQFRAAGYHHIPDTYGNSDRSLYLLKYKDGRQVAVSTGKITSTPYEVGHAACEGLDLRKTMTMVFVFDGKETIEQHVLETGDKETYTGKYGHMGLMLMHLKQSLGASVGSEEFAMN